MFEAALDAVVVMAADGCVMDWNPAAMRTFGYSREEAIGRELAALIIPDSLRERHRQAVGTFLETRAPKILDQRLELAAVRASGEEFPVELTVTRVPDVEPPLFAGFVRDLTKQRAAEREREELEQRLAFLAEAGLVLEGSLQLQETLETFAQLTVPGLADVCVVDLVEEGGAIRGAVVAAGDPEEARAIEDVRRGYPLDPRGPHPVAEAVRSRKPLLVSEISSSYLESIASGPEHVALMQRLGYSSAIVSPLVAHGLALGAVSLLRKAGRAPYEPPDLAFVGELSRRAAVAVDNARLYEATHHVARTLQQSLLPDALPDIPGVCVAARYHAAARGQQVGGDFYDVFELDEGAWGLTIGDVCGKGPEAAALTALARHTVRAAALHDRRPATVLEALNSAVRRDQGEDGRFLSVVYGTLTVNGGLSLDLAAGGHPPPLMLRANGHVERLEASGPLIGVEDVPPLVTCQTTLAIGDTLALYTDGLLDAGAPAHTLTEGDLREVLERERGKGAERLASGLEDSAISGGPPRDDVAILVLEATGSGGSASASQRYSS